MKNLFQLIIATNCLKFIRSVFQLDGQGFLLDYQPPYQRKYVWTEVKATYLIETILLHGEIPPIVIYEKGDRWEVIDGRQRCEAIDRFIKDDFSLRGQGLDKLWNLAGKKFSELDINLRERIQETKLRFIIIMAKDENTMSAELEEQVKREIFKRYNSAILPLRKEEVIKAQYLQDDINIYFKECFERDVQLYSQIVDVFDHRKRNVEMMMQHIRQLLVLHNIPINRYVYEREDIVNMYYDYLSYNIVNKGKKEDIEYIFNDFKEKFSFLVEIKELSDKADIILNGYIYECIYWALSVCVKEKIKYEEINNLVFKNRLVKHLEKQASNYISDQNYHAQKVKKRYSLISSFFSSQLDISFATYLNNDDKFIVQHKEQMEQYMKERLMPGQEQKHFSKVVPTESTVEDILDMMQRGKFDLQPPYQRVEVMNYLKASSLIESIIIGVKLNPIYVYVRKNGVFEVIDGQQRLLAIIGFMGERYRNANGDFTTSKKHNFTLRLRSASLPELDGRKFDRLPAPYPKYLKNCKIDIIEIKESDNEHFKPEELFKRLNSKPFPIKENTFEHWNACADGEIINSIKDIHKKNTWLYLRKDDKRMLNEELITCLSYLHYMTNTAVPDLDNVKEVLDINKANATILVKIKNKSYITKVLESSAFKEEFLLSLNHFEINFIEKVKSLTANPTGKTTELFREKRLGAILQTRSGSVRTSMSFYVLWLALRNVPLEFINEARSSLLNRINKLFLLLKASESTERLEQTIIEIWAFAGGLK